MGRPLPKGGIFYSIYGIASPKRVHEYRRQQARMSEKGHGGEFIEHSITFWDIK